MAASPPSLEMPSRAEGAPQTHEAAPTGRCLDGAARRARVGGGWTPRSPSARLDSCGGPAPPSPRCRRGAPAPAPRQGDARGDPQNPPGAQHLAAGRPPRAFAALPALAPGSERRVPAAGGPRPARPRPPGRGAEPQRPLRLPGGSAGYRRGRRFPARSPGAPREHPAPRHASLEDTGRVRRLLLPEEARGAAGARRALGLGLARARGDAGSRGTRGEGRRRGQGHRRGDEGRGRHAGAQEVQWGQWRGHGHGRGRGGAAGPSPERTEGAVPSQAAAGPQSRPPGRPPALLAPQPPDPRPPGSARPGPPGAPRPRPSIHRPSQPAAAVAGQISLLSARVSRDQRLSSRETEAGLAAQRRSLPCGSWRLRADPRARELRSPFPSALVRLVADPTGGPRDRRGPRPRRTVWSGTANPRHARLLPRSCCRRISLSAGRLRPLLRDTACTAPRSRTAT